MASVTAVILAAGHGTRMKSNLLKVLHPIGGKPMLGHVIDNCRSAGIGRIVLVVGVQKERVQDYLGDSVEYAVQEPQLGTGHAVLMSEPLLRETSGDLLVLYGDNPFLSADAINHFLQAHRQAGVDASLLSAHVADPAMLGRIVRDDQGQFLRVVEYKDATPAERNITEINSGIYCFKLEWFWESLRQIRNDNAQNEYYLPDVLDVLRSSGRPIQAVAAASAEDVIGPNDRKQLAQAEAVYRQRILDRLMANGVTIMDPNTTWVGTEVSIAQDVTLYPFTFIEGKTTIASGCVIGPMSRVVNCQIAEGTRVEMSVVEDSMLGAGVRVGPYAHVRAGCELGSGVELGNFSEVKKTRLGANVKMHHHSYLGDAEVGERVNIGAGVITSNYDGFNKWKTVIEQDAFIGTNVNIVAPVHLGTGAYVAAGSTINKDVPSDALAIARAKQENKTGYGSVLRERARTKKKQN